MPNMLPQTPMPPPAIMTPPSSHQPDQLKKPIEQSWSSTASPWDPWWPVEEEWSTLQLQPAPGADVSSYKREQRPIDLSWSSTPPPWDPTPWWTVEEECSSVQSLHASLYPAGFWHIWLLFWLKCGKHVDRQPFAALPAWATVKTLNE